MKHIIQIQIPGGKSAREILKLLIYDDVTEKLEEKTLNISMSNEGVITAKV